MSAGRNSTEADASSSASVGAVNPAEVIAEAMLGAWETPQEVAAHVVSKLSEHGYSILPTAAEPSQQLLVEFDYRSDGGPTRVGIFSSRLDAEAYVKSLGSIDAEWCVAPLAAAAAAEEDTNG